MTEASAERAGQPGTRDLSAAPPLAKRLLPRRLLARSLLIIMAPLVLLQIAATWFFFSEHDDVITKRLAQGIAGGLGTIIEMMKQDTTGEQRIYIFTLAEKTLRFRLSFEEGAEIPPDYEPPRDTLLEKHLGNALVDRLGRRFAIDAESLPRDVEIRVQLPDGVLRALVRREQLFSDSTYIFIIWMVGASLILAAVAFVFMRNQVRPIRRLAEAAESFGKGRDVSDFRLEGATEVRQAAAAFLLMRARIKRQIEQRTTMLAGVSHDLRTPLTRMKLQLAMLGEDPEIEDRRSDVNDMQRMVDGYLAYARGQDQEPAEPLDLAALVRAVADDTRRQGATVTDSITGDLQMIGRPNGLKRCLTNLMENSRRHADGISLLAERRSNQIYIQIDDDGPGIPAERRTEMFRPFRRLDDARGPDTGGAGLGLTIARDVVRRHGGEIRLGASDMGGLRVELRLPV